MMHDVPFVVIDGIEMVEFDAKVAGTCTATLNKTRRGEMRDNANKQTVHTQYRRRSGNRALAIVPTIRVTCGSVSASNDEEVSIYPWRHDGVKFGQI